MRVCRTLLLWLAVAAAAGCADEVAPVDRGNPQAVVRAALIAVHDGDWKALERLLTKDARFALEKDMRRLQANLAAPRPDSQLLRVVEHQLGDEGEEAVARAVQGDLSDMLRFFMRLSPRDRDPQQRGIRIDPGTRTVTIPYLLHSGEERAVTLVQERGRWSITNLQL